MTKLIDAAIFTIDSLVAVLRMLCQRKIKKKYTTEREAMNKKKKDFVKCLDFAVTHRLNKKLKAKLYISEWLSNIFFFKNVYFFFVFFGIYVKVLYVFQLCFLLLLSSFPCDGVLFVVVVYSFPRNRVRSNTWTRLKIIQYVFIFEYTFFCWSKWKKKKHLKRFNINSTIYLCIDWIECYGAEKNKIFKHSNDTIQRVCATDGRNTLKCIRNQITNRC